LAWFAEIVPADSAASTVTVTELGVASADPLSVSVTVSDTATVPVPDGVQVYVRVDSLVEHPVNPVNTAVQA
jgi:hypothetical protein